MYNIDPGKIGFVGFSAGAHLGAHISTAFDMLIYKPVDNYDKLSSRPDLVTLCYPWYVVENNSPDSEDLSKEINVTSATPPTILFHGLNDKVATFHVSSKFLNIT